MYILHTTLVGMYIVGVRFGQKPQRAFRPKALWEQASCVPRQKEPVTHAAELTPTEGEGSSGVWKRHWMPERTAYGWVPLDAVIVYG